MVAINMEIPSGCYDCPFAKNEKTNDYGSFCECGILEDYETINLLEHSKHPNCPLVDIEERKVGKCTDCEEYNHEKHYCPKFCDVIRNTTKEMQDFYKGEHEKLERIEQIVNSWDGSIVLSANDWKYISEIKKVLEQE